MFLFDTDAISQVIKRSPSLPFIRKLASTDIEQQFTTIIAFGELVYRRLKASARSF
jgi:predicted nucleic acid-binding protein